jgi:3-oxoadipate enol-lactonase
MTEVRTDVVEVNDGMLEFDVAGEGLAVAFLHPGLWDRRTWDHQVGLFAKTYRVLRYDARGYGRSSRPERGRPYSHVEDLVAVMDAAGIDRAALVGCSMGAATAIDAALVIPERVTALVLAAPGINGDFDLTAQEEAELERLHGPVEAALSAGDLRDAQEARMGIWAALGAADDAGRRIRDIAFDNLQELEMDESAARQIDPPPIERLEGIMVPTLILPAERDPGAYRRVAETLASRIPDARLVRIPNTDHVLNMRRPAEFDDAVLSFLGEVL